MFHEIFIIQKNLKINKYNKILNILLQIEFLAILENFKFVENRQKTKPLGHNGLEPLTSPLSGVRSNLLS